MTATAILLLLGATLAVGIIAGVFHLSRARRPLVVRVHLVLALASAAVIAALALSRPGGAWPAGLVTLAAAIGYAAFRLRWPARRGHDLALIAHVALGIAGFFVFLAWRKSL